MICVQSVSDGVLQVVNMASGDSCQFISLMEPSDLNTTVNYLDLPSSLSLIGAAAACYALVFVIKTVLGQLGYRG